MTNSSKSSVPAAAGFTLRSLVEPFIFGGALSVVRLLIGLIRVKYLALLFGAAGIGLISQGNQLQLMGMMFVSLSLNTGLTQRILSSSREGDPGRESRVLPTVFTVQIIMSLILTMGTLLLRRDLSLYLFGSSEYSNHLLLVVCSVPLFSISSAYLETIFFGSDRYDLYIKASISSAVVGFLVFVPLVFLGGMTGVFLAYVSGSVIHLLSYLFYLRSLRDLRSLFKVGIDWKELKILSHFSGMMVIVGILSVVMPILIRSLVIKSSGLHLNGILQVPIALSAYYAPFLTNLLWGKLHPKVGAMGDDPTSRNELFGMLKFIILLQSLLIVGLLTLPELLINIFYSTDFSGAVRLLPYQFIGDFFYYIVFTVGVYFLGVGRVQVYVAGWLIYFVASFVASYLLLPGLGIKAVLLGHIIGSVAGFLLAIIWIFKAQVGLRAQLEMVVYLLVCGSAVGTQCHFVLAGGLSIGRLIAPVVLIAFAMAVFVKKRQLLAVN